MREESHLDDMRAAIRGDFERLEERRGEQDLMRISDDPDPPEPEPETAEPSAEIADELEDAPATEPEPRGEAAQAEPEPEPRDEAAHPEQPPGEAAQPERSWLDRLLGR